MSKIISSLWWWNNRSYSSEVNAIDWFFWEAQNFLPLSLNPPGILWKKFSIFDTLIWDDSYPIHIWYLRLNLPFARSETTNRPEFPTWTTYNAKVCPNLAWFFARIFDRPGKWWSLYSPAPLPLTDWHIRCPYIPAPPYSCTPVCKCILFGQRKVM